MSSEYDNEHDALRMIAIDLIDEVGMEAAAAWHIDDLEHFDAQGDALPLAEKNEPILLARVLLIAISDKLAGY
jgi:hypothetical protein